MFEETTIHKVMVVTRTEKGDRISQDLIEFTDIVGGEMMIEKETIQVPSPKGGTVEIPTGMSNVAIRLNLDTLKAQRAMTAKEGKKNDGNGRGDTREIPQVRQQDHNKPDSVPPSGTKGCDEERRAQVEGKDVPEARRLDGERTPSNEDDRDGS